MTKDPAAPDVDSQMQGALPVGPSSWALAAPAHQAPTPTSRTECPPPPAAVGGSRMLTKSSSRDSVIT